MDQARPEEAGYSVLAEMVAQLKYKPGWTFHLHWGPTSGSVCSQVESGNSVAAGINSAAAASSVQFSIRNGPALYWQPLLLTICVRTEDAWHPGRTVMIEHTQAAPYPDYHPPWHRWLLDCIRQVENHEIAEIFEIAGQRPFYPEHGPNADLYAFKDRGLEWPPTPSTKTA